MLYVPDRDLYRTILSNTPIGIIRPRIVKHQQRAIGAHAQGHLLSVVQP